MYNYTYPDNSLESLICNPLHNTFDEMEGIMIHKNKLSDTLVDYLLMDFNELQNHCGHVTVQTYKKSIIHAITYFMD